MGFKAELLILHPEHYRETLSWLGQEVISFGHVTRLEKLTNKERFGHVIYTPRHRAGICVVNYIVKQLSRKLDCPDRTDFAPPFLVTSSMDKDFEEIMVREHVSLSDYERRLSSIDQCRLVAHNRNLKLPNADLLEFAREKLNLVMGELFLWAPCSTIAEWLDGAEEKKSEEWLELERERVSLALARAWRAYLAEVGKVGVRALFVFPF